MNQNSYLYAFTVVDPPLDEAALIVTISPEIVAVNDN